MTELRTLKVLPSRSHDSVAGEALRPDVLERLARREAERAQQSLLRRLRSVEEIQGTRIVVDGKALLNFAGNDYLGLAQHPALRQEFTRAAQQWGVGASAAHLLGGHRDEHTALEEKLAQWTGRERALLFSTGYMANMGAIGALLGRGDVCIQDKLNHASLLDGAHVSGADLRRYAHCDVEAAARQLGVVPASAALLATEGVFSMNGDVAPLAELAALCRNEKATFMVDDAHGLGVLGEEGAGSLTEAGLEEDAAPVLMATLGKALGVAGAFVAGSAALIQGLIQFARSYVYTTAMPPALAAAASVAVDLARSESWRREHLNSLIAQLRAGAQARAMPLAQSRTPIQPLPVGSSAEALRISVQMEKAGFYLPAVRPPTVPAGGACLRISLSSLHTEADVERLLDALAAATAESA
jgi:8-amino-7-oxononanoate synthase